MASAQVLPSSTTSERKLWHLEAGKKRLEEFRKKKAEGRAKKAASTGQLQSAEVDHNEKGFQGNKNNRSEATSDGNCTDTNRSSTSVLDHEGERANPVDSRLAGLAYGPHSNLPFFAEDNFASSTDNIRNDDKLSLSYKNMDFRGLDNGFLEHREEGNDLSHSMVPKEGLGDGVPASSFSASSLSHSYHNIQATSEHLTSYDLVEAQVDVNKSSSHNNSSDGEGSRAHHVGSLTEKTGVGSWKNNLDFPSTGVKTSSAEPLSRPQENFSISSNGEGQKNSNSGGSRIMDTISRHLNRDNSSWNTSENLPTDSKIAFRSSFDQLSASSTGSFSTIGRSRPSFLDSLGVHRASIEPHGFLNEPDKTNLEAQSSKLPSSAIQSTSTLKNITTEEQSSRLGNLEFNPDELSIASSIFINQEQAHSLDLKDNHAQAGHDLSIVKDENFATLEQLIEDLTQEKFSLQRALDTSRGLTESLAAENSSLTDSYNQQGKVVSQLRSDMERLQEEIKAQLLVLESIKMECTNAQLECDAADERAKMLASEVIGLEDKALRLRSNELKLERQLESLSSEISTYKQKVSSLEKERQDFRLTIGALQEEKKILQSKIRKSHAAGKFSDTKIGSPQKKDASTSTEDFGAESYSTRDGETSFVNFVAINKFNVPDSITSSTIIPSDTSVISLQPEVGEFILSDVSSNIPHDQLRMIDNIRSLIAELALEKEELMQALTIESSNNSKLQDLNKDLSQKLEAQTQRLELLTSQRMAHDHIAGRPIDTHIANDATELADEGDEVVERVLSWIMRLFPGGPGKRRISKLL